ncbi:hypothetical protein MZA98_09660 [Haemophilus influenzae]
MPKRKGYPLEPSDLSRCVKLLERAPEMRQLSSQNESNFSHLAKMVEHWDELERLLNEEKGSGKMP